MAWLNLTMPNKTVKNGLTAKKIKLPQMNFFSWKATNKTFMYLLAPFILQNFKKILRANPELWGCAIFRTKMAQLSWTIFFGTNQTIIITFIYLLTLFIVQNLKKFLQQMQSSEDVPFLGPKWSICLKQILFWKIINIILIYLLVPSIVQNFKKILPVDPKLWRFAMFWPSMACFPKCDFFSENLLLSLVSFIHTHLHAKNQSQILIYDWNIDD